MYIKYRLCETTGQIKCHQIPDVTNSRSIFVIHSNFFVDSILNQTIKK